MALLLIQQVPFPAWPLVRLLLDALLMSLVWSLLDGEEMGVCSFMTYPVRKISGTNRQEGTHCDCGEWHCGEELKLEGD